MAAPENKILDDIIEVLDYIAYDTDHSINSDAIWSGNTPVPGTTTSSEIIRIKIERLKFNMSRINKKFQVHFSNLSQTIKPLTDINLD
jgi:hypothetical protein